MHSVTVGPRAGARGATDSSGSPQARNLKNRASSCRLMRLSRDVPQAWPQALTRTTASSNARSDLRPFWRLISDSVSHVLPRALLSRKSTRSFLVLNTSPRKHRAHLGHENDAFCNFSKPLFVFAPHRVTVLLMLFCNRGPDTAGET